AVEEENAIVVDIDGSLCVVMARGVIAHASPARLGRTMPDSARRKVEDGSVFRMVDALALVDGIPSVFLLHVRERLHQPVVMETGTGIENGPLGVDRSRRIETGGLLLMFPRHDELPQIVGAAHAASRFSCILDGR